MNLRFIFLITFIILGLGCDDDDTQTAMAPTDPLVAPPVSENNAPVLMAQTFTVAEDIADDVIIGMISATDAEDDDLMFTLTQNNDDLFELTENGELSLVTDNILDFEK